MRTLAAVAAAALAVAGCTTGSTAGESSPPVRQVAIAALPEEAAHDDALALQHSAEPVDRSDPAAVAVELIVAGLAEQRLEVVDVGVETLAVTMAAVTVRVAATHRAETTGAAHTSVYELDLARDPGGSWRLVGFGQVH
jgi:hypothetical protein